MVLFHPREPRDAVIHAFAVSWLSLIAAVIGIVRSLVEYLRDRQAIDSAVAETLLKTNREALDAIEQANKARQRVRSDIERNPADLMSDDGFKRDD
jgi:hypothetical protein